MRLLYTEYRGHEVELAKLAVEDKVDIVAICGGCGTAFFAIQELVFTKIAVVLIPTAAGNIFSHLFGIRSINKGLNVIKDGVERSIDIGEFRNEDTDSYYFMCYAGAGISPISAQVSLNKKRRHFLDYVFSLYSVFMSYKPHPILVRFHSKEINVSPFEIFIGNIQTYGKTFSFIPYASVFDGLFDVLIIPKMNLLKIISFSLKSFIGLEYELKDFSSYYKVDQMTLIFKKQQLIQLDYEPFIVEGECVITVNPLALNILVPKGKVNI